MNGKSTLALVLLTVLAGLWLWQGDALAPRLGIKPRHEAAPISPSAAILDSLSPATLTRVEVVYSSGDPLVLERGGADSTWKLPGNWPPRKPDVEKLVETLGTLRSRFSATPISDSTDLKQYGLAGSQKPLVVKLVAKDHKPVKLTFGDPSPSAGETAFTRPAFVRVNDLPELLQIGPDVMPVVHQSPDAYRRRQLFTDVERVRLSAATSVPSPLGPQGGEAPATVTLPGESTVSIEIHQPGMRFFGIPLIRFGGTFTLTRLGKLPEPAIYAKGGEPTIPPGRVAEVWALNAPVRDRAEPERLRSLLVAVADLWVEQFVNPTEAEKATFDARTGLADSTRAITVKQSNGDSVTVRFGEVSKTGERTETMTMPSAQPGMPPQSFPRKVPFDYRYAKIDGNPQVFVVSAEKFPDLFVKVEQLTDSQVARFSPDEVDEVVIRHTGSPEVKLTRKKGNPKATVPAETMDRWFLDAKPNPLIADNARVDELLNQLSGFRSDRPENTTYPTTPPAADTKITIVAREKRAEGEPDAPARTFNLEIGKPEIGKRLLPVQVFGWPRVTLVSDKLGPDDLDSWVGALLFPKTVSSLLARPALAYRGRKLFDTTDTSLASVAVTATSGGFSLSKDTGEWKLTQPLQSDADPGKANQLAATLSSLESTEYLPETPSPDVLKQFGLDKPAQTVTLNFTGGRTYKLDLGTPRPGKPEVFARLDGGDVFGLPSSVVEQLTTGVIGLLPLKVWATPPDKVSGLEITRTGDMAKESFLLANEGTAWKLSGPFVAPIKFPNAQPLLAALGNLQAVKYQAMTVANPAEYGLDKPLLKLKLSYLEKKPVLPGTPPKDEEHASSKTLVIGGLTSDGGNRYAMLEQPNAPVFVVPAAFVIAAQTPPLELLDRSLLVLDPNRISKVRITSGKPEDAFSLTKDEKGKWSAEGTTFGMDAERIARLASTLSNLPVIRLSAYGDAIKWADFGLEKPGTTITVILSGEKTETHTIALGNVDPSGAQFVRVDEGKAVGVIPGLATDSLTRKKFDYADRALLTFDPTALVGFNRKQGKDELELAPAAAIGWDIIKPAKNKADQMLVEELTETLAHLHAEKISAYGKKEDVFKQFGLEPPAAVLTLTIGDKAEKKVLRLGNPVDPAKPEGDRYASVDSPSPESSVGVLPAVLVSKLLAKDVAFRDRTLAKFVDADKAILERGDRKITFAKVGVTWKVTEPLAANAEHAALEALIADLGKLRVDTWAGPKTGDLKEYGLDKPEAKWTIFDGDKPVLTLLLGKKMPDGRVNVATDKSELVGLLDPMMTFRVLAEYRQRQPWDVDAAQVEAVEIAKGGTKFELQKSGPIWFDPAKANEPVDVRVVNELNGTLGALRVDRYVVDKNADPKLFGLDPPEMRITVTSQNRMTQSITKKVLEIGAPVGGTDGKQRYARVVDKDRTDVFVLTAADTGRLTRDRAEYGMKK